MRPKSNDKDLSPCEKPIMKIVWNTDGDIAVQELIMQLRVQFGKDYARTTVVTFLKKLSDKGYVSTYRVGNAAYVHPEIPLEEYRQETLQKDTELWFNGRASDLVAALVKPQKIDRAEIQKMRELLDELDK